MKRETLGGHLNFPGTTPYTNLTLQTNLICFMHPVTLIKLHLSVLNALYETALRKTEEKQSDGILFLIFILVNHSLKLLLEIYI